MKKLYSKDSALKLAAWASCLLILSVFFMIIGDIFLRSEAFSFSFLLEEPQSAGREGGIFPVLISTGLIILTCGIVSLPIALGSSLFLFLFSKKGSKFSLIVRLCLDVLASTPSIVFGLFGSAFFCVYLGLGFSILSGGLTLACMVLPLVIRLIEEGLASVPKEQLMNCSALGFSKTRTFFSVLLPQAAPLVTVALLLGIGRALSETAALLFTSGYVLRTPSSLLDSGRSLSIHIYDLAMNIPGGDVNAYRSALVLMVLLLLINTSSLMIVNFFLRRQQR